MRLHNWDQIEEEKVTDLFYRRYINSDHLTLARIFLKKGCVVQAHSHENDQMSTVITGSMKFVVDGEEIMVGPGETLHIPPGAVHSAEALEDTDALDVFAPSRQDWIEGRDAYLRT
jgi:quercetin dioxygenase-like cupin family protein